jgi:hypothetical protein
MLVINIIDITLEIQDYQGYFKADSGKKAEMRDFKN